MTNDKIRQVFEAWAKSQGITSFTKYRDGYSDDTVNCAFIGYQAGRAAERAEIVAKLESEGVAETVAGTLSWWPERGNLDCAKAAITKILEVI